MEMNMSFVTNLVPMREEVALAEEEDVECGWGVPAGGTAELDCVAEQTAKEDQMWVNFDAMAASGSMYRK
jgi:hypothetical protein